MNNFGHFSNSFASISAVFLALFILSSAIFIDAAYASDYVVIVHKENELLLDTKKMKSLIKSVYLKERRVWPGGFRTKPFSRTPHSEIQKLFANEVLDMSEGQLQEHWLSLKSKQGTSKPREVSAKMLIKLVGKYKGAIGCVSRTMAESAKDRVSIALEF